MKKLVLVLTLAVFALTGSAFAQDPTYFNNIGVYADTGALQTQIQMRVDTTVRLYLVMSKITTPAINGWEVKVTYENIDEISFSPRGDAIDAATRPNEHIVGLGVPIIPNPDGTAVLADIRLFLERFVHDPSQISTVHLTGVYFHALPHPAPAYVDADDVVREAHTSTFDGHLGGPVFIINSGPVAVEQDTWGGVKSLYR